MQAEHGQVFVVAASHLIFLLRQPSQALITERAFVSTREALQDQVEATHLSTAYDGYAHPRKHSLRRQGLEEGSVGTKASKSQTGRDAVRAHSSASPSEDTAVAQRKRRSFGRFGRFARPVAGCGARRDRWTLRRRAIRRVAGAREAARSDAKASGGGTGSRVAGSRHEADAMGVRPPGKRSRDCDGRAKSSRGVRRWWRRGAGGRNGSYSGCVCKYLGSRQTARGTALDRDGPLGRAPYRRNAPAALTSAPGGSTFPGSRDQARLAAVVPTDGLADDGER